MNFFTIAMSCSFCFSKSINTCIFVRQNYTCIFFVKIIPSHFYHYYCTFIFQYLLVNTVTYLHGNFNDGNDDKGDEYIDNNENGVIETGVVNDIDMEKSLFSQMLFSEDQSLIPGNSDTCPKKEKTRKETAEEIPLLIKVRFPEYYYRTIVLCGLIFLIPSSKLRILVISVYLHL